MSTVTRNERGDGATAHAASRLRIGILVVFGLILLIYLAGRLGLRLGTAQVLFRSHPGAPPASAYLGDGIMLLLTIAVYWLTAALKSIAKGGLFTRQIIGQFRQFALWLLVMAVYSFVGPLFFWRLASRAGTPHRIMVAFDIRDLLLIGITGLLFLVTRLLERAGEIEQENQEIV